MVKENISYEQHKLENLHKQLSDYKDIMEEVESHCGKKYGISLATLKTFMNGVKQDIQKEEQSAMRDGSSINLSDFKDRIDGKEKDN